ncbi:multicopper oxidase domain-containing protein [Jidongwangia harbinensis]|uniref:multicopper oxidase domain-containing protein n=1 Tax=Jidongwangia harbinensis TaxID=2878561 RepID=UPI001CD98A1B|nr:multicopper oxidase domain-containing protein [Jidongwangia harbinensis]MCA2211409.1 multicopper oxidase domain-containing protein [Jidongwangia harbinensis]
MPFARTASATLLLSILLAYPAVGLLHLWHHAPASHAHATTGGDVRPTGPGGGHDHGAGSAPRDAAGHVDHTAMAIVSGQMDGPSAPTNGAPAQHRTAGTHDGPGSGAAPWWRDAALAVPVIFVALLLTAALAGALTRARGRRWRLTEEPDVPETRVRPAFGGPWWTAAGRAVAAGLALAVAAPGHGVLFGEPAGSVEAYVLRVLLLCLPVTGAVALAAPFLARAARAVRAEWQVDGPRRPRRAVFAGALGCVLAAMPVVVVAGPAQAGSAAGVCPAGARSVTYDIAAFSLVIPLNGWGDKLPDGAVYALRGADARVGKAQITANPALSEPLVVRANVGDCVRVNLRNDLGHRVGLHPDGLVQFDPETSDGARVGRNPDSTVPPGGTTTYTWYADKQGEAPISDIANIDAADDEHTSVQDGLYGAVVVHPQGSVWTNPTTGANLLDPATGQVVESRAFADVATPAGALRSYAMVLMDENEDVKDRNGRQPTFPTTGLPDSTFGINYRSEPLRNRLRAIQEHRGTKTPENPSGTARTVTLPNGRVITPADHFCDGYVPELGKVVADPGARCMGEESHLQSWVFGDEGKLVRKLANGTVVVDSDNLIPKAYVGDPVQFHVVHPGAKETHPWHQHTQRWFKDPNNPDSPRNDVQSIGPGEGYRMELEGGAGGVQRTAGDSVLHCHLYPHFAQGMWGHLRIFDRLRNGSQSYADGTPIEALRELPGRAGQTPAPTATQPGFPLFVKGDFGQRAYRAPLAVVKDDFAALRRPGDAPRGPTALEAAGLPALDAAKPGNGYIDPCPSGAATRTYRPHVVDVPIVYNSAGWKDRQGRVYVEESQAAAVRAGTRQPEPFTIRARLGECIQVYTTNDLHLDEDPAVPLDHVNRLDGDFMHTEETSEVSTHVHLVKFDELGSDGTSVGWNYSSSAMPGQTYGYRWFVDQPLRTVFFHDHQYANLHQQKGLFAALHVEPADATWHDPKTGTATDGTGTVADIRSASGPDFREITVFHQDRIPMWKNNGTGDPVNPPPAVDDYGADQGGYALNYRNEPFQIRTTPNASGPKGDPAYVYSSAVHGDPATPVFRAYPDDPVVIRNVDGAHEEVHTFNIHGHRWLNEPDNPASTVVDTQSLALAEYYNYEVTGSTVKRKPRNTPGTLKHAKNESANGAPSILNGGAGPAGDYLYGSTPLDDQWLGMWGIFRVPGGKLADLQQLPDQKNPGGGTQWPAIKPGEALTAPPRLVKTCPAQSADRTYDIAAIQKDIVYHAATGDHDPAGALYVLAEHEAAVRAGTRPTEPLYLRANAGDCLKVTLTNKLPAAGLPAHTGDVPLPADAPFPRGNRVSLHPALVEYLTTSADGATVGYNYDQTVAPGGSITAYWYVPEDLAGSTATLVDFGDRRGHRHHGLFAGLLIEPKGSTWSDPATGAPIVTGPAAVIRWTDANGRAQVFREHALQWQDGLNLRTATGAAIPPAGDVDDPYELGNRGVNYRTERFAPRLARDPVQANVLSSTVHGDPATPVLRAYTGDPVKVRLLISSDRGRAHTFVLSGHGWNYQAADPASTVVSARGVMLASQASSHDLVGGAGGPRGTSGDFLYRDGNQVNQTNAGLWGLLRVHSTPQTDLLPLR